MPTSRKKYTGSSSAKRARSSDVVGTVSVKVTVMPITTYHNVVETESAQQPLSLIPDEAPICRCQSQKQEGIFRFPVCYLTTHKESYTTLSIAISESSRNISTSSAVLETRGPMLLQGYSLWDPIL